MSTRVRWTLITLIMLFVALLLLIIELDRLVSQVGQGHRFSILDVTSVATFSHHGQ